MIKRIKTGVKGFDGLVKGGFPSASTVLVTGSPGTGKTIFGLQFLYHGALKYNEKGLYITFEQTEEALKTQAKLFGWDLESLLKKGKIEIMHIPTREIDQETGKMIVDKLLKNRVKRLVIDSITTLAVNAPIYTFMTDATLIDVAKGRSVFSPPIMGDFLIKRFLYGFIDDMKNVDHCTTLLISESPEKANYLSRDTVSEFVCDGLILITFESMGGEFSRNLIVRKMRHTKNDDDVHPLEINEKEGLIVHSIKR
jgi:circadian clock protein KaiC